MAETNGRFCGAKRPRSGASGLNPSLRISAGKVTGTITRGGSKPLHKALNMSVHRLISRHNEMFGIWGCNLQQQTGKKKKAANAVARKLSVAMFYMMMKTGTVIDRTRRMVPCGKPATEIVTCTIQDGHSRRFYVDDYAPGGYHNVNSAVCFPVYVIAYNLKNGVPSCTLNVQKVDLSRGEHF